MAAKKLKLTLIKSTIGSIPNHRECVRGLGLRKTNHVVLVEDTPSTRGMVNKVRHLLKVEGE